jgi:hypothetical protein
MAWGNAVLSENHDGEVLVTERGYEADISPRGT